MKIIGMLTLVKDKRIIQKNIVRKYFDRKWFCHNLIIEGYFFM